MPEATASPSSGSREPSAKRQQINRCWRREAHHQRRIRPGVTQPTPSGSSVTSVGNTC